MEANQLTYEVLNQAFGVDEELSHQAEASPSDLVMPHFLPAGAYVEPTKPPSQQRSPNHWDPRLILDLAIGIDSLEDILASYGLTEAAYNRLTDVPSFRRELAVAIRENRENGITFAKKAAVQAESYLEKVDEMVWDPKVPASTCLEAIKWCAKMGKLEPREDKAEGVSGTQVNLQINFTA